MAVKKFYNTAYTAFRGVDYSTSPSAISDEHASDLLNMIVGENGVMQKRPGWRVLKVFDNGINGIHYIQFSPGRGTLFIHTGTELWFVLMTQSWRHIIDADTPYFKTISDVPTMEDVQMIRDYLDGMEGVQAWQVKNMDINGDGRVTEEDAQILQDYIVNLAAESSNGVLSSAYRKVKLSSGSDLSLQNTRSTAFVHDGYLYILDGDKYYRIYPEYAGQTNLLDTSTLYTGLIQSDGTLEGD